LTVIVVLLPLQFPHATLMRKSLLSSFSVDAFFARNVDRTLIEMSPVWRLWSIGALSDKTWMVENSAEEGE